MDPADSTTPFLRRGGVLNVLLVVGASSAALLAIGVVVGIFVLLRWLPGEGGAPVAVHKPVAVMPAAPVAAAPAPAAPAEPAGEGPAEEPARHSVRRARRAPAATPAAASGSREERRSDAALNRGVAAGLAHLAERPALPRDLEKTKAP